MSIWGFCGENLGRKFEQLAAKRHKRHKGLRNGLKRGHTYFLGMLSEFRPKVGEQKTEIGCQESEV